MYCISKRTNRHRCAKLQPSKLGQSLLWCSSHETLQGGLKPSLRLEQEQIVKSKAVSTLLHLYRAKFEPEPICFVAWLACCILFGVKEDFDCLHTSMGKVAAWATCRESSTRWQRSGLSCADKLDQIGNPGTSWDVDDVAREAVLQAQIHAWRREFLEAMFLQKEEDTGTTDWHGWHENSCRVSAFWHENSCSESRLAVAYAGSLARTIARCCWSYAGGSGSQNLAIWMDMIYL